MPEKRGNTLGKLAEDDQNRLPIHSSYNLLDVRQYVRTKKTWVALCVLQSHHGKELKLYQWEWRDQKGWKVGLANLRVESLNLGQIAADAKLLAEQWGIDLKWT